MRACGRFVLAIFLGAACVEGFVSQSSSRKAVVTSIAAKASGEDVKGFPERRSFLSNLLGASFVLGGLPTVSKAEEEESFASIAARAAQLSSTVGEQVPVAVPKSDDPRTAYDFSLPVSGQTVDFKDIVHQTYNEEGRGKVKAILVVNMKEDDPTARKDIPEFISLAAK